MSSCPPLEHLRQLVYEELTDSQAVGIENHVESCTICQQAMEALTVAAGFSLQGSDGDALVGRTAFEEPRDEFLKRLESEAQATGRAAVTPVMLPSTHMPPRGNGAAEFLPIVPGYVIEST